METIDTGRLVERMATAARVIHRFSRWGAGTGLVVGALAFLSLVPWMSGIGALGWPVAAVFAVLFLGAPLRVMWHGGRIGATYGDRVHVDALLAEIPGAVDDLARELDAVVRPQGRGLRRLASSWRSMLAVRRVVQESPARERANVLVDPLRPEALSLTSTALVVTVIVLVSGVPVAVSSLVALALA